MLGLGLGPPSLGVFPEPSVDERVDPVVLFAFGG